MFDSEKTSNFSSFMWYAIFIMLYNMIYYIKTSFIRINFIKIWLFIISVGFRVIYIYILLDLDIFAQLAPKCMLHFY